MASKKKLLQAAAGAAGGEALNVEDVFSTYLYTGNDTSTAIDNGVDLAGEGGLVWVKARSTTVEHVLYDTERGALKLLQSQSTAAELTQSTGLSSFNSNGFTVGTNGNINGSPHTYASWTFRKAPKFFDVQTFTATSSDNVISHNLSSEVGTIFLKPTSSTGNWWVYHRSLGTGNNSMLQLNTTSAQLGYRVDTPNNHFSSVSSSSVTLTSLTGSVEYVMYLFAHNDGDGEFGPDGDQDIIKCGSYTGNGSADGPEVDLGFEPQWIITKAINASGKDWNIYDSMRGFTVGSGDFRIKANTTNTESVSLTHYRPTATGFKLETTSTDHNGSGTDYIYIAIRRGPMAVPTDATDVFDASYGNSSGRTPINLGFSTDAMLYKNTSGSDGYISTRLTGSQYLSPNSTAAEATGGDVYWDDMDGISFNNVSSFTSWIFYNWKRAPSFFDVVAYTGNGSTQTINHNLGVAPEMIWVKNRTTAYNWSVYHADLGSSKYLELDGTAAAAAASTSYWQQIDPTESAFYVGNRSALNKSGDNLIAYLFASVEGVSKVGSYTGTGSAQNIDCGFSSGARFVMIKRSDGNGSWEVWDTERGIVTGSEGFLRLNNTNAEGTTDWLDPYSGGFQVSALGPNAVGGNYIFYAIA